MRADVLIFQAHVSLISRAVGSWGFSREAWAGLAEATWLRAARAGIGRLFGTITIPYKLLMYTGQFWALAAPEALWAAPAGLAWVVLPGCLAGWSGWLIRLIWLAGWVGWLLWLLAPSTGCWRVVARLVSRWAGWPGRLLGGAE